MSYPNEYNETKHEGNSKSNDNGNIMKQGQMIKHDYCEGNKRAMHYHDSIRSDEVEKAPMTTTEKLMKPQSVTPED